MLCLIIQADEKLPIHFGVLGIYLAIYFKKIRKNLELFIFQLYIASNVLDL